MQLIAAAKPDRIITIGGNCIVSQAPFDYLHGIYDNVGIIRIDAHPDVSTVRDGYPNAHAMVIGSLMGKVLSCLRLFFPRGIYEMLLLFSSKTISIISGLVRVWRRK